MVETKEARKEGRQRNASKRNRKQVRKKKGKWIDKRATKM
jgi:hypothetical protein